MPFESSKSLSAQRILWVILFSIAMGYLEAAVVIYLREIYYPAGFGFPLSPIEAQDFITETGREAATLIMLVGIGVLSGKTKLQKMSFFLMSFGIWDIFYYLFLKWIINWPANLFTPDILFLLPVPWVGPVICPIILSLTMILLATVILYKERKYRRFSIKARTWLWFVMGSLIVIASFCLDPIQNLENFAPDAVHPYRPENFMWWLFILGELLLIAGIVWIGLRKKRKAIFSTP